YAEHKRDADLAVQRRAASFGSRCSTVILRPQIFAGPTVHNYMIDAIRGEPSHNEKVGKWLRKKGKRMVVLTGLGGKQRERKFQFVHVDDVARTIAYFIAHPGVPGKIEAFNLTGSGESLSVTRCCEISGTKIIPLPTRQLIGALLKAAWSVGASDMPPDALPYVLGEYTLSTKALQSRLGADYSNVIRFTNEQALRAAVNSADALSLGSAV
ncbi:MAG: NAD-dependent epimerase/dehydratase family protein, partial [Acidobacteriales bacterium]|nr:NAD-dependent epimerase/dehydratase family protein [Terriglobales bacterium]